VTEFAARYQAAFEAYVVDRSERSLGAAYELGRAAVTEGVGVLDLAEAHHATLRELLPTDGGPAMTDAAADFFRESLAAFELAHRGYREAHETARIEQEHARRQHILADAGMALNSTLDTEEILRIAADQAVQVTDTTHAEARLTHESGQAPILAVAPEEASAAHEQPIDQAALIGRGRRQGRLAVWGDGPLDAVRHSALVQLALMASAAVENAQRYAREREIADTLQRSLLPPAIPEIPGLQTAVRFWSAGEGMQVGGDFYDLFGTADGDWALAMGDVCGKGPDAAALTALTRHTIRAAARHEASPAKVLEFVNDAMLDQRRDSRFATVLYGVLRVDDRGARLVIASGGHPPPFLVRPDGRVGSVPCAGTLLGIVEDPELSDAEVRLEPGDTLLLYTDGVVEIRSGGREVFGTQDLAALLEGCAGCPPDELLARVEEQVLLRSGGRLADDAALLAVRLRP